MLVNVPTKGDLIIGFHYTRLDQSAKPPISVTCYIRKNGQTIAEASSYCHPVDRFERTKGRKLALARALATFSKPERTTVWQKYVQTCTV